MANERTINHPNEGGVILIRVRLIEELEEFSISLNKKRGRNLLSSWS